MSDFDMRDELARARRYSVALRHLLGTGLEPATYDEYLCEWSGPLLPIERVDRRRSTAPHLSAHRLAS